MEELDQNRKLFIFFNVISVDKIETRKDVHVANTDVRDFIENHGDMHV